MMDEPHDVSLDEQVLEVISRCLEGPRGISPQTLREEVPSWDSLKHVEVILAIEEHFSLTFTREQLESIDGVPAILVAVRQGIA